MCNIYLCKAMFSSSNVSRSALSYYLLSLVFPHGSTYILPLNPFSSFRYQAVMKPMQYAQDQATKASHSRIMVILLPWHAWVSLGPIWRAFGAKFGWINIIYLTFYSLMTGGGDPVILFKTAARWRRRQGGSCASITSLFHSIHRAYRAGWSWWFDTTVRWLWFDLFLCLSHSAWAEMT